MARKRQTSRFLRYKSYNWVDQDPIVDAFKTFRQDTGVSFSDINKSGGPSSQTMRNWERGITRRPQFCTIWAAARTMGTRGIIAGSNGYPYFMNSGRNEQANTASQKRYFRKVRRVKK